MNVPRPVTGVAQGLFWLALVWSIKLAQAFLAPVAVALVLTFLMAPGVRAMQRRGVPLAGAAAVMVGALLVVTAVLVGSLYTPGAQWLERLPAMSARLFQQVDKLRARLPFEAGPRPGAAPAAASAASAAVAAAVSGADRSVSPRNAASAANAANALAASSAPSAAAGRAAAKPGESDPVRDKMAAEGMALTGSLLGGTLTAALAGGVTVVLLFLLLVSEQWMVLRVLQSLPHRRSRIEVLATLRRIQRDICRFFGSYGVVCAGVGLATMAGMMAIGLPNPLLWGVISGLLNLIPYLGPILVGVALLLAGLVTFDPGPMMLAPPLVFLIVHLIEANLVTPWFVGRRLVLSPIAVFVSILFWLWVWGLVGAFIAVPMLIALRSLCGRRGGFFAVHLLLQGGHEGLPTLQALLGRAPDTLDDEAPAAGRRWSKLSRSLRSRF